MVILLLGGEVRDGWIYAGNFKTRYTGEFVVLVMDGQKTDDYCNGYIDATQIWDFILYYIRFDI